METLRGIYDRKHRWRNPVRMLRQTSAGVAPWYNQCYTRIMKTAISIPNPLFKEAERFSKRHKLSRSRLYSLAVAAYLKTESASGVRERLDAVYGSEDSSVDAMISRMQEASLNEEDWPCAAEKSGGRH